MDWTTAAVSVETLVTALGGTAALVLLLVAWLGRIWSTRIAQRERAVLDDAMRRDCGFPTTAFKYRFVTF